MRISDWSSDVCSSDLLELVARVRERVAQAGQLFAQLAALQRQFLGVTEEAVKEVADVGAELVDAAGQLDDVVGDARELEAVEIAGGHAHGVANVLHGCGTRRHARSEEQRGGEER